MDELTRDEIDRFLDERVYGRMGCHDAGLTYVVPLIYARQAEALYVMTTEGLKIRVARNNPAVCFEVDEHDPVTGNWKSVIVQGRYEELDAEGTAVALGILGKRFGARRQASGSASPATTRPTVAFRIQILSATGRRVLRDEG